LLHSIGFAPQSCLGGGFLSAPWEDVRVAWKSPVLSPILSVGLLPLLQAAGGGSVVALDFDAAVAWPGYDWMGVAKAALESTARYLARDLGQHQVRVNLVAAGPIRTVAARPYPGYRNWTTSGATAPARLDINDSSAVSKGLRSPLSDWFRRRPARSCTSTAGSTPWGSR